MVFCLSSACDVMFFIVLLCHFICVGAIQIDKVDSSNQKYQIMVIDMLKN